MRNHVIFKMSDQNTMIGGFVSILLIFSYVGFSSADRVVSTTFLSDEHERCNYTIGYIKALGGSDDFHYLVTTIGVPTVLVAYTKHGVEPVINWEKMCNETEMANSVTFSDSAAVHDVYSLLFTKLIQYEDSDDKADMNHYGPGPSFKAYDLNMFTWEDISTVSDKTANTLLMKAAVESDDDLFQNNGTFSIRLRAFSNSGREDELPHLEYSENITQFDLVMDHLWSNWTKIRFAVETVMVSKSAAAMKVDTSRSIDDEYAPGVFNLNNWLTNKYDTSAAGFLQWKPVCYNKLTRARSVMSQVKHYDIVGPKPEDTAVLRTTLLYAYYGHDMTDMVGMSNFSFGMAEDGFYNKTNVLTWSASIGYGDPPMDGISTIVIIIISSGLGLPIVLIVLGGVFVCVKKRNSKEPKAMRSIQNGYQPVSSD